MIRLDERRYDTRVLDSMDEFLLHCFNVIRTIRGASIHVLADSGVFGPGLGLKE
jgi:hypothetical protein